MQYKLFIMKQVIANKERKFKKGLQRRLELICNYLNFRGASYNYLDITIKFERNEPVDEAAKIAGALQLNGFTSKETALSYLPSSIVSDIPAEMDKLEEDADSYANSTFTTDAQSTDVGVNNDGQTESNQESI